NMRVTLGGPVADPGDRAAVLERFLRATPKPVFTYVRDDDARSLADAGLHTAGMGIDRHVDVAAFLERPAPAVESAARKAARRRFMLREVTGGTSELDGTLQRIDQVYLRTSQVTREISFLNFPVEPRVDGLRRTFTLEKRDRESDGVFGYAVLNPIYDRGA